MLASAGDDGNTLLWVPSETYSHTPTFGEDTFEDKETWRIKHMCRSSGSEIYDLAWSPDGIFFITGSMDNIARIYNAQSGQYRCPLPNYQTKRLVPSVFFYKTDYLIGVSLEHAANGRLILPQGKWYGR